MEQLLRSAFILLLVVTVNAQPSLVGQDVPGATEKKRTPDRVASAYAHLLTIIAPPGNHAPEQVAARNAKLFADMEITPKQGEILASIASKYRNYLRFWEPEFRDGETKPLPPITPYEQVRTKPLSIIDQVVVLKHMLEFQDRIDSLETQLRVTGYCEREILPKITVVYGEKD